MITRLLKAWSKILFPSFALALSSLSRLQGVGPIDLRAINFDMIHGRSGGEFDMSSLRVLLGKHFAASDVRLGVFLMSCS